MLNIVDRLALAGILNDYACSFHNSLEGSNFHRYLLFGRQKYQISRNIERRSLEITYMGESILLIVAMELLLASWRFEMTIVTVYA